jgi:hypothetical protein
VKPAAPPKSGAARSIVPSMPRADLNNNTNPKNSRSGEARRIFRLISWFAFPFDVVGSATVARGDLVVEDVMISTAGNAAFALVKQPAGLSECEWGDLGDAAVALVRKTDPGALAGTADLFEAGQ